MNKNDPSTHDVEIKDATLIFNSVWKKLAKTYGEENLAFPKEIFWLNGAPGSGKGTNTKFIMDFRSITGNPIVVSDLLRSPEAKRLIDKGMLVGDREVSELVFKELLKPERNKGVIVDGYPRTHVQVECLKLLYNKLKQLRSKYINTEHAPSFRKPHFHIVVLFIDEKESVGRQIKRGQQMIEHNKKVEASGVGEIIEVRATDLSEDTALGRYNTFKSVTYEALKSLREEFYYHYIDALGSIEEVRQRIIEELKYQSSLELDEKTNDRISHIPVAQVLAENARQDLVSRLDSYERHHTKMFAEVVKLIDETFIPIIIRHAISGFAIVNSEDRIFEDSMALTMLIDIFSERGYHAVADINKVEVPIRFDPQTNRIETTTRRIYRFTIRFQGTEIRRTR
ncbi:MAG: nucleoside monophosphate kinase [Opitutales bacterium]|nr:nucleoside monophosphate kinase [Opitutales bacterium]